MSNKTVLVLGGSSMVGNAIKQIIETEMTIPTEKWVFCSSKDGDLTDYNETKALFDQHKPTHVVSLAAKVGGLFANLDHNVEFLRGNMQMNDNILKCSHEYQVEKVVSCMSTCILPTDPPRFPMDESMVHLGIPHRSNWGYAFGKRFIDAMTQAYNIQYGYKWTSVIPCNVYGPYDNFNLHDSHVIPGLIHKCYLAQKENKPLVVAGTGKPLRQFLYSFDLARLYIWALRDYEDTEPIILSVGADDEVSIRETVDAVVTALNFEGEVIFDDSKSDGAFKKTVTNQKMMGLRPDFVFTPFRVAVKETADWFVKHYDTKVRK